MRAKRIRLVLLITILAVNTALAGGDKNRGEKGQGYVHQVVGP